MGSNSRRQNRKIKWQNGSKITYIEAAKFNGKHLWIYSKHPNNKVLSFLRVLFFVLQPCKLQQYQHIQQRLKFAIPMPTHLEPPIEEGSLPEPLLLSPEGPVQYHESGVAKNVLPVSVAMCDDTRKQPVVMSPVPQLILLACYDTCQVAFTFVLRSAHINHISARHPK